MWIILVRAAITGVFGSAFGKWFLSTRMGIWFQKKLDRVMEYLAVKYDINIAKKEAKWKSDYPLLVERIAQLESWSHPPIEKGGASELLQTLEELRKEIETLKSDKQKGKEDAKKVAVKKTRRKNDT